MIVARNILDKLTSEIKYGWLEMPTEKYHADKSAVNSGSLKCMMKSPRAFARSFWGEPKVATKPMKFGTLAHMAILEGDKFKSKYKVMPEFESRTAAGMITESKNTTYYKEQVKKWLEDVPPDAIIVSEEERAKLFTMIESVLENPKAVKLLSNGKTEAIGYWKDPATGINMRMAADFISFDLGVLVDLKTTTDSTWGAFRKSVENYNYPFQMAHYAEGIKNITGKEPKSMAWIAIESQEPYEVKIHELDPVYIEGGAAQYRNELNKLKKAIDNGVFNQETTDILIGEPSYFYKQTINEMEIYGD